MRNVKCKKFKGKGRKGIRERGREGERGKQRRKKRRRQRRERDRWGGREEGACCVWKPEVSLECSMGDVHRVS